MTPEQETLAKVLRQIEALGIPYMVAGSVASSYYGRPRMTHDVDVVLDPAPAELSSLVGELARAGLYVNADVARRALESRRQFNVIEARSGLKIDMIVRKDRPFSREELGRRRRVDIGLGLKVAVATAEDTILSKLEWASKAGGSERQLSDVVGIVETNPGRLETDYIERWATELGVLDLWREASSLAEE